MPGRRVSEHSAENTLPLTVALPIFKSRVLMGTGLTLMGLPSSTLSTAAPPSFPPPEGAAGGAAALTGSSSLQVRSMPTWRKP